jgi:hypothetical protein
LLLTTGESSEETIELQENKNKNKYVLKESSNYPILSPGQTLTIDGIFRHPDWGISAIVFWNIPFALWVGAGLGIFFSLRPHTTATEIFTQIASFFGALGFIVGVSWGIWKIIQSNYPQVSLFANVGFHSIFDYFMIASIGIFSLIGVLSFVVPSYFCDKPKSWQWGLGIFFFVLGIVAILLEKFFAFPFLINLAT